MRASYSELLKAGGSEDADILLKRAGFNAGSTDAYEPMLRHLERLVSQLDAVLAQPQLKDTRRLH